jgi:hypothetical protein
VGLTVPSGDFGVSNHAREIRVVRLIFFVVRVLGSPVVQMAPQITTFIDETFRGEVESRLRTKGWAELIHPGDYPIARAQRFVTDNDSADNITSMMSNTDAEMLHLERDARRPRHDSKCCYRSIIGTSILAHEAEEASKAVRAQPGKGPIRISSNDEVDERQSQIQDTRPD